MTGPPGELFPQNHGIYGIVDQYMWRKPGSETQGIAVFVRIIGSNSGFNAELVDFYTDMGITFSGMIPHRPHDALALGFAYVGISDSVQAFDVSVGAPLVRNYESGIEICYTMQLRPGWTLQPDFQYIWQPGGNVFDDAGRRVENAAVVGARTTINF